MTMVIEQIPSNISSIVFNTNTGVQMVITNTTSDAAIIGQLCSNFSSYILFVYFVILAVLILKLFLRNMHKTKPDNELIKTLFDNADSMIDMMLIFIIVLQLLIYFFYA